MALNGTPGQALVAYYAEPGTPEHDAITLLDRADADQTHRPFKIVSAPHITPCMVSIGR
jgi:hypothetical protein